MQFAQIVPLRQSLVSPFHVKRRSSSQPVRNRLQTAFLGERPVSSQKSGKIHAT
jgi:hypothetical protein